jgi:hypothetical protein
MTIRSLMMVLCCLSFFARGASAEENQALFIYGGLSCDDWNGPFVFGKSALRSWLLAFLAEQAAGGYRVNVMAQTSSDKIVKWVDDYCQRRPLDGLAVASIKLLNELADRAAASK